MFAILRKETNTFKVKFENVVTSSLKPADFIPVIQIDAEVTLADLTNSFFNILQQMEPFGPDNSRPIFCARRLNNKGSRIVKEQHIRFQVEQNGINFTGIGFNLAEKFDLIQSNQPIDLVFSLEENIFNGQKSLQLKVIDLALSSEKSKVLA